MTDADAGEAAGSGPRGARLGLPPGGPGSLAGFARRLVALAVDWVASILVTALVGRGRLVYGTPSFSLVTLGVFAVEVFVLTWLAGGSFGQLVLGLRVVALDGGRLPAWRALFRTVLVCLVVPPLVWDRDGRGLHDRAVDTAVLRLR